MSTSRLTRPHRRSNFGAAQEGLPGTSPGPRTDDNRHCCARYPDSRTGQRSVARSQFAKSTTESADSA